MSNVHAVMEVFLYSCWVFVNLGEDLFTMRKDVFENQGDEFYKASKEAYYVIRGECWQ